MMEKCIPSELNIFDPPSMSAPYQKVQYVDYRTASPLNDGGPLQFIIPPTANQFIDLRRTLLHVEAKIMKTDGDKMEIGDTVFPINLPLHTVFSQVDVELQQQLACSNRLYGYKAMVETLLETNYDGHETYLGSQGFTKEKTFKMEPEEDLRSNPAFAARFSRCGMSRTMDLEGPLMADICQQDRLLLNGVEVNIKLWPAKQPFMLLTTTQETGYELVFEEVYLRVCKVMPTPAVTFGIADTLKEKPALYPYMRTEMRAFQLQAGQLNFHLEDMYQQNVPTEVIVCMVNAESFHGDIKKNPFNFDSFGLTELALYVDDESVPSKPLKMDFTYANYVDAYNMLFENPPGKSGCFIKRNEFDHGYAIFRFRVTPENVESLPSSRGNVKLSGTFKTALTDNITLIVIGKFHHMLKIDNTRSIQQ